MPPAAAASALAEFLEVGRVLVLTGAGLSTDSGIPDYRGPDGQRRVQPMRHEEFVASGPARQRYWARSFIGWARFTAAAPNAGHRALAALQEDARVGTVITQNVDGLHQRAGSRDVVELHGSLADVGCLSCGHEVDREVLQARMERDNPGFAGQASGVSVGGSQVSSQIRPDGDIVLAEAAVLDFRTPLCDRCGADTLKPEVVFFGGNVPRERVDLCYHLTEEAPGLLVLGSSLAVMSGLRFVRRAAQLGRPVAILTHGPTRGDEYAALRLDADLSPTLSALVAVPA